MVRVIHALLYQGDNYTAATRVLPGLYYLVAVSSMATLHHE